MGMIPVLSRRASRPGSPGPLLLAFAAVLTVLVGPAGAAEPADPTLDSRNPSGLGRTLSTSGTLDRDNPFFESLGTNGRSCATCHVPSAGWSLTAAHARRRFERTGGRDPLFRTVDGSTSPHADVSTLAARRQAYRLLLSRGLIRIGLPMPENAEFTLVAVDDPHGYASAGELSLFRRPLPAANLKFLTTLMWDGRQTRAGGLHADLTRQAVAATRAHAEADKVGSGVRTAIVAFETSLFTTQVRDRDAGALRTGPRALARQAFFPGINNEPFDPVVFTLFTGRGQVPDHRVAAWQSLERGEAIFNIKRLGRSGQACSVCHNAPNAGSNSMGRTVDLGLSDVAERTPDLPLYTLRCLTTGLVTRTTDPGRALATGRCVDINRFKVPALRGLAARAPYFHNGAAATLEDVVDFYDRRFGVGFTPEERADLALFLRSL
jgi:cytochrome c peroxidase